MLRRWMLIPLLLAGMAGAAFLSQQAEPAGLRMTSAGQRFVASLKAEQKAKALSCLRRQGADQLALRPVAGQRRAARPQGPPPG